jgi:hypothetical protein
MMVLKVEEKKPENVWETRNLNEKMSEKMNHQVQKRPKEDHETAIKQAIPQLQKYEEWFFSNLESVKFGDNIIYIGVVVDYENKFYIKFYDAPYETSETKSSASSEPMSH